MTDYTNNHYKQALMSNEYRNQSVFPATRRIMRKNAVWLLLENVGDTRGKTVRKDSIKDVRAQTPDPQMKIGALKDR